MGENNVREETRKENVIAESHNYSYCRRVANSNEERTGNKTIVQHFGTRTSGLSEH